MATGGVGGAPTAALVGGGTAGSPQPSPISTGELIQRPKGCAGQDGVQPRGTEAAVPGAGPGSGGPPFRLCATADLPGEEVAAAGDTRSAFRRKGAQVSEHWALLDSGHDAVPDGNRSWFNLRLWSNGSLGDNQVCAWGMSTGYPIVLGRD